MMGLCGSTSYQLAHRSKSLEGTCLNQKHIDHHVACRRSCKLRDDLVTRQPFFFRKKLQETMDLATSTQNPRFPPFLFQKHIWERNHSPSPQRRWAKNRKSVPIDGACTLHVMPSAVQCLDGYLVHKSMVIMMAKTKHSAKKNMRVSPAALDSPKIWPRRSYMYVCDVCKNYIYI